MKARDALLSRLSGVAWPHGPLLEALTLPPASDVLDIGCGDGDLLASLRQRGHSGRLVGLDREAISRPEVETVAGDAHMLPFPDASFDAALLVRVLDHLDAPRALAEAWRVLRTDGLLVVARQTPAHLARFWTLLGESAPATDPEAALRSRLAPFGPPEVRHLSVPIRFERAADLYELAASHDRSLPTAPDRPFDDVLELLLLSVRRVGP